MSTLFKNNIKDGNLTVHEELPVIDIVTKEAVPKWAIGSYTTTVFPKKKFKIINIGALTETLEERHIKTRQPKLTTKVMF